MESKPPEIPTTTDFAFVCSILLASPATCILNISWQRLSKYSLFSGIKGCGFTIRCNSSIFVCGFIENVISLKAVWQYWFSENVVFFILSFCNNSKSTSAYINCVSFIKRSDSFKSVPFSYIKPWPLNTISCVDSPIPEEEYTYAAIQREDCWEMSCFL